jgi:hypothetical protein
MSKRERIQREHLDALDSEFRELLIVCLEHCSRGRWGLFGTFDHLGEARRYWAWPEADHLRDLAKEIETILAQSSEQNVLCREFLNLCKNHGQNDPGEPKVARSFLDRIRSGELGVPV